VKLFFRQYGSGDAFVILHGLFGLSDNWVSIARRIAEQYKVFIPDLRNHGQSPHHPLLTFDAMSDDLDEFLDDQKLSKVVLMGHSLGGKTAMKYALENTDRIDKLIVVDISPKAYTLGHTHLDVLNLMRSVDFDHVSNRKEIEELVFSKLKDERLGLFVLKNLYRINRDRFGWRVNLDAITANLDFLAEEVIPELVFDKPALFIRGGDSNYILDEDIPLIHKLFPKSEIKSIPGATHWVHADAPEAMCMMLHEFLGKKCDYPGPGSD
jgi:esterase